MVEVATPGRSIRPALALALGLVAVAFWPTVDRWRASKRVQRRLDELETSAAVPGRLLAVADDLSSLARLQRLGPLLASWETVGGCGAGANAGTGGGIKWIGRNVTGGRFRVESQADYLEMPYGYNYVLTTLVSRDVTDKWTLGVSGAYLYKLERNFAASGRDVANQGPGDVNVLVTRRLGPTTATSVTVALGLPTGTDDAEYMMQPLAQDRQLGYGKVTATVVLDHVVDRDWGPIIVGGTLNHRGGRKPLSQFLDDYRAPSASTYAYAGVFLGPFVPALGCSLTGALGHDRNNGSDQSTQLVTAAATASVEWSTDWASVLLGASVPYGYDGITFDGNGGARSPWGFGPWVLALGFSVAP